MTGPAWIPVSFESGPMYTPAPWGAAFPETVPPLIDSFQLEKTPPPSTSERFPVTVQFSRLIAAGSSEMYRMLMLLMPPPRPAVWFSDTVQPVIVTVPLFLIPPPSSCWASLRLTVTFDAVKAVLSVTTIPPPPERDVLPEMEPPFMSTAPPLR